MFTIFPNTEVIELKGTQWNGATQMGCFCILRGLIHFLIFFERQEKQLHRNTFLENDFVFTRRTHCVNYLFLDHWAMLSVTDSSPVGFWKVTAYPVGTLYRQLEVIIVYWIWLEEILQRALFPCYTIMRLSRQRFY